MYQSQNLIFGNLKFGINLYFPIPFLNNIKSHKLTPKFPLETPHKLKQIIIKLCHDFNAYTKLHWSRKLRIWSHLLQKSLMENFMFVQCCIGAWSGGVKFFRKKGILLFPSKILLKAAIECSSKQLLLSDSR